jgi:hypothetical protein
MKLTKLELSLYTSIIALLFCAPAFYNGFPIQFPDTASYINAGFNNHVQRSRPWLYSGFIRHISLWETLWLVIFVQGLLTAGVIYLMFKEFYKGQHKSKLFILYSLIIGTTTAVSFHVSRLMPDIFTPIVILLFALLLLEKHLSRKERVFAVLLFVISSGMHNAHLVMNIGMILVVIFGSIFKGFRAKYGTLGITKKRVSLLTVYIVCTHLFICTVHYSKDGGFVATKGGSIFLFARLCDLGIAQAYLEEHCDNDLTGGICASGKKLFYGGNFLWNKKSYLNESGGWTKENEAYLGELTKSILTTPKYLKAYIIRSIEATFIQVFNFDYSPAEPNIKWVTGSIKTYYPMYILAADGSRQMQNNYNQNYIDVNNVIQQIVLFIAVLLILLLLWESKVSNQQKALTLLIIFGLLINAFIAAATSGVYDRYQSRVNWLITLPAFWFICHYLSQHKLFNKKQLEDEFSNS